MEEVRKVAMFCVGRAVFFGVFAISIIMLSFAFDLTLMLRSGAILTLSLAAILVWYAQTAHQRKPKVTETWILLEEDQRPQNQHSIKAFSIVMKEVYGFYAYYAVIFGCALLVASILMDLTGLRIGLTR